MQKHFNQSKKERFNKLYILAQKAGLLQDHVIINILTRLSIKWDEYWAQKLYEIILHSEGDHLLLDPVFKQPRDPELTRGDINIAQILDREIDFGIRLEELPRLTVIFGNIGSGKTSIAKLILKSCLT